MKSSRILLASLLSLALATSYSHAQETPLNGSTPNINPGPKVCCDCYYMYVIGAKDDGAFHRNKDGSLTVFAKLEGKPAPPGLTCESSIKVFVTAAITSESGVKYSETREVIVGQGSDLVKFEIPPDKARLGRKITVESYCGASANQTVDEPTDQGVPVEGCMGLTFDIKSGCSSCDSCRATALSSASNGSFSRFSSASGTSGGFSVSIPTLLSSGGDLEGSLEYHVEQFSNPGRVAIMAALPTDMQLTRTDGLISSVDTGAGMILVTPAIPTILALDPNAFTIIHKDLAGNEFRTTTISFVTEGGKQRLRMDTTFDGSTIRHEQTCPDAQTMIMEKGRVEGIDFTVQTRETLVRTNPSAGVRIERRKMEERADGSVDLQVVSDEEITWEKQISGWVKTKEIIDPNGAALTSTWSYYQPGDITGPSGSVRGIGELKQHIRYDGYESFYTYGLNLHTITTPYAGNSSGKVTTTTWDPGSKTEMVVTTINGQMVSKSTTTHTDTTESQTEYSSATGTLTTVTHYVPSGQDNGGKPTKVVRPDNTLTTYTYTRNAGGGLTTFTDKGSSSNSNTVSKGTRSITTTNSRGTTILSKTEAIGSDTGTASFGSMAVTEVDSLGRAIITAHNSPSPSVAGEVAIAPGAAWLTKTFYSCCGVAKEIDMYGIPTFYTYDSLQRQIKINRLGVTTEIIRKGLTTETHRYPEAPSESLTSTSYASDATLVGKSVTDLAGTMNEYWSPDPTSSTPGALVKSTKATSYKPAAGLSTRTVSIVPSTSNHSQTTDSFLDGRTAATYGALSPAMAYSYSANGTGEVTSQSYVDGTNLRETTTTQSDWAGRTLSTTYMDGAVSTVAYNSVGQMTSSTEPYDPADLITPRVTTLYAYNAEGEGTTRAIDLNANGVIDYGVDTVSSSESDYAIKTILTSVGSEPVMETISQVWKPGQSDPTVVSTSMRSANGLRNSSQSIGVAQPSTSITALGQANDGFGNGSWTATGKAPDGTMQVQAYANGLLASSTSLKSDSSTLHTTSYGYDNLNRPNSTTDSRTGATNTNYLSTTSDTVVSVTEPGNRSTAFTYDVRGRTTQVDAPDSVDADGGELLNITTTSYNSNSTVAETTGDQTYRTTHTYDYAQRQVTMTTYGTETATTTWQYSPTRGFLLAKRDAANKGANYTYTAAGRLATRTWARGVTTTYSYDNGGRMVSTVYSDGAPNITMAYDALGRQISQSNGIATTTYAYDSDTLALDTETIAYDLDSNTPGPEFTRVLDRSQDSLMRSTGYQLKTENLAPETSSSYTYGLTDGRPLSVSGSGLQPPSQFNYSYIANSNLLSNVTGPAHTVTNTWEVTRDVLASKENKVGTTVISDYEYNVNNLGQRTQVSNTGTAFTNARNIAWGYNSKGEVVKADSSESGLDRAYQYDGIGNRLKSADSLTLPSSNNYSPNALNQYTAVESINPGYDDDGNATAYPLPANLSSNSTLAWDAENRLISATVNSVTTTYLYDSQSRRIAQTTGAVTTLFVYDGWNPIAEYSTTFALTKSYTWGMDLSGSMQGAGGVGGLLVVTDGTGSYFPTFDGNGNVSEYLDTDGAIVAHYEYDPFGKATIATGSKANDFAHRFSTKPLDLTIGLYYYGYRWYDPVTGRWPSRDPIEEQGGVNLYGFIRNDGVSYHDLFGLVACQSYDTFDEAMTAASNSAQVVARSIVKKGTTEMNTWRQGGGITNLLAASKKSGKLEVHSGNDFAAGATNNPDITVAVGREVSAFVYCFGDTDGTTKYAYANLLETGKVAQFALDNNRNLTVTLEAGIPLIYSAVVAWINQGNPLHKGIEDVFNELVCSGHDNPKFKGFTHTHSHDTYSGTDNGNFGIIPTFAMPLSGADLEAEKGSGLDIWAIDALDNIHK